MPAFGDNTNVACYMDDLSTSICGARANDAVGRVRPGKREEKPAAYTEAESACMGNQHDADRKRSADLQSRMTRARTARDRMTQDQMTEGVENEDPRRSRLRSKEAA